MTQLGLLLMPANAISGYLIVLFSLPLFIPFTGFIKNNRYTYQWAGFLPLFYFCIGISELVSNQALQIYAYLTILFSTLLFFSTIYYTRRLRQQTQQHQD